MVLTVSVAVRCLKLGGKNTFLQMKAKVNTFVLLSSGQSTVSSVYPSPGLHKAFTCFYLTVGHRPLSQTLPETANTGKSETCFLVRKRFRLSEVTTQ